MADKLNKKRERGANYTPEEKTLLVDLILQYKHIIEDKSTGGHIINKKKEAWREITVKYNSNCTTGSRQMEQIKALYDNLKQKSRKDIGERNKMSYINNLTVTQTQNEQSGNITKDDLARALKNLKEDKVQLQKTGGGFWKPKMTESDSKILSIIHDQVEPLSNPEDSAAVYFNDDINDEQIGSSVIETVELGLQTTLDTDILSLPIQADYGDMYPLSPSTVFNYALTHEKDIITTAQDHNYPSSSGVIVTTPSKEATPARSARKILKSKYDKSGPGQNKLNSSGLTVTTPSSVATPARRILKSNNVAAVQKKVKKPSSAEALKRIYFKKKCENAYLERKKLMKEILNIKEEHNLKMMILKKKLDNLNKC